MTEDIESILNREVARLEAETITQVRQVILEQHSSSFKWLNASLLAINGGGCVAVLSIQNLQNQDKAYACFAFILGILAALLSARVGQSIAIRGLVPLQRKLGYWTRVSLTGERDVELEDDLQEESKAAIRWAWIGQASGWLSVLAFVLAALLVGLSYQ